MMCLHLCLLLLSSVSHSVKNSVLHRDNQNLCLSNIRVAKSLCYSEQMIVKVRTEMVQCHVNKNAGPLIMVCNFN